MNWFIICLMVLFVGLGALVLFGKGDGLIAGYNTASKEEREKVNIKRLRLLIAVLMFLCAALMPLLAFEPMGGIAFAVTIFVASFVVVYLANTWAMKK